MQHVIYDIETGARPESEIAQFMPEFAAPANYKDPEKIAAYVESAKRDWLDKAALSPLTGKVLCVGVIENGKPGVIAFDDESNTIGTFWSVWGYHRDPRREFVGFNTHHFDLPFLIRRSWALGVTVPYGVRDGRRWHEKSIDH